MTVTQSKTASCWSPTGWGWEVRPPAYDKAIESEETNRDWSADLRAAGYNCDISANEPDDGMSTYHITVWRHPGDRDSRPHLFVEIWDMDGSPAHMFVAEQNIAPFFFDKLPELIRNQREINAPNVAKSLVAFVRHGHGPLTISEHGDENRDERQRRLDREAYERDRKAQEKQKAANDKPGTPQ